jgi:Reverse transcriptase (RNA-dependent DNA polymerase).
MKITGGIFCDLHKAFDCVNHRILLSKLEFYGIEGSFLKLIKSHLEDINQKVQISAQNYNNLTSKTGEKFLKEFFKDPSLDPCCFSLT